MAKRRNENGQMRREEYEASDQHDDAERSDDQGFQRASEDAISRRKIVKARTGYGMKSASPAVAAPVSNAKKNPFESFQVQCLCNVSMCIV